MRPALPFLVVILCGACVQHGNDPSGPASARNGERTVEFELAKVP